MSSLNSVTVKRINASGQDWVPSDEKEVHSVVENGQTVMGRSDGRIEPQPELLHFRLLSTRRVIESESNADLTESVCRV